tara:strand:+ start:562 stop:1410 length:849 start_codon:yes stop_codon:yes gene_type:complete
MSEVIKAVEFPDREFESKQELFRALREDADKLIAEKKATYKDVDGVQFKNTVDKSIMATKGIVVDSFESGYIYPVINTTNYLDSHNDLHIKGIWNKTYKEQKGKVSYIVNHELKIGSEIAYERDVDIFLHDFTFDQLGYNSKEATQALMFKIAKNNIVHAAAKDRIDKDIPTQNSVRMIYVTIDLAMNSDDKDDATYKKRYDKYVSKIANRDDFESIYHFWVISEAKIHKEGSMVVAGSNDITPMVFGSKEPPTGTPMTPKDEPSEDTHKIVKALDFSYKHN